MYYLSNMDKNNEIKHDFMCMLTELNQKAQDKYNQLNLKGRWYVCRKDNNSILFSIG